MTTATTPIQNTDTENDVLQTQMHGRIAFVHARWHHKLVARIRDGFLSACRAAGVKLDQVEIYDVAGAFELPLRCKQLAQTQRYSAIVAAGLITDGGIYRHEFVASSVGHGLMQVQLETDVPIVLAVLTLQRYTDDEVHTAFLEDHLALKGAEAASVALGAINRTTPE